MTPHTITNVNFFKGGRATFTVKNPEGEHYTYRINKGKDDAPYFAAVTRGNGYHRHTYMGIYVPEKKVVIPSKKHGFSFNSLPVKVLNWAVNYVNSGKELPDGYDIHHEGRCCKCGKELTDSKSVSLGIGPVCRKG